MTQHTLTGLARAWVICLLPASIASGAAAQHVPLDQSDLTAYIAEGRGYMAMQMAFDAGDRLTTTQFGMADGVGANVGDGTMFTRLPRADLDGPGQWAQHVPHRETGVNATACVSCHGLPVGMGAGELADNILADPGHTGDPAQFLTRNPPSLFALGIPQRLAEEISTELRAQHDAARDLACEVGGARIDLASKGVSYGRLEMRRVAASPCQVSVDNSGLDGIDVDLIIRPFGWKGTQSHIRAFARNAAHNELGMQPVELVGDADGDFDGVTHEMSVGDITALTVFFAALPRPVSSLELADIGAMEMTQGERAQIIAGEAQFAEIGCAGCHVPAMPLQNAVFSEPTTTPGYFDVTFPDGSDPAGHGLMPDMALTFDLAMDQPDNRMPLQEAGVYHMGALELGADGLPVARWFTDFKRHDMGAGLADPADPLGMGAAVFATRSLAGVGTTGPWLHDGRAVTLSEAILAHGGDAQNARDAFAALVQQEQDQVVAFLQSLQLYRAN